MRFFDTNVLVYRQDAAEPIKRAQAQVLIEDAMADGSFTVSTQVMLEFYNTMLRRAFMPAASARALCEAWAEHEVVSTTPALLLRALDLQQRYAFSVWDAMIVQAALESDCHTLYSEDLQHGMKLAGLTVVNPFNGTLAVHENTPPLSRSRPGRAARVRSIGT